MTPLTPINIRPIDLYDTTVASVACPDLRLRLTNARNSISSAYDDYIDKGLTFQLHTMQACLRGKYNQTIMASLSKKDLNRLYSYEMLDKSKPARKIYDKIITCAPHGLCPICGIGDADTVDHFAAKAYYPTFAVLIFNLAPACTSCNKNKSAPKINQDNQTLHPHFEPSLIHDETWLKAVVLETHPPTISFFADPPSHWSQDLRERTLNHFQSFNLKRRYGIQAAAELTGIIKYLSIIRSELDKRNHLTLMAAVERSSRRNSWQAAMYEALSTSTWVSTHY